ncbi:MAG: hypothetical protein NT007_15105 [Candidatus Kapabacteria bacterium]|nr:hypothetical protein [Candidatus Kapabacteria bacterium]
MSEYVSSYKVILDRLEAVRRRETSFLFLTGFFKAIAAFVTILFLFTAIEAIANGDKFFRSILALLLGLSFLSSFIYFNLPAFARFTHNRKPSFEQIALRIGDYYPDLKDKLCNIIQLLSNIDDKSVSQELTFAAYDIVRKPIANADFNVIIEKNELKKSFIFFLIPLGLILVSFIAFPATMGASLGRIVNYNKSYLPPPPFTINIDPENAVLLHGEKADIIVRAKGTAPDQISLLIKEENQENYDVFTLKLEKNNTYIYHIASLRNSLVFFGKANWLGSSVTTNNGKIKVIERPLIKSFSGKIIFPAYTSLASKEFTEQTADIAAVRGSQVEIQMLSNKPIKSANLIIEKYSAPKENDSSSRAVTDSLSIPMKIDGQRAAGNFRINQSGSYYISITDMDGQQNVDPIKYNISALLDAYPTIALLMPQTDIQVNENAMLPMRIAISDDFGFSSLKLHYKLVESRYTQADAKFQSINIPLSVGELTREVPYLWNLQEIGISPEDKYEYYLELFDNDVISGPKSAKTQTLSVRMPSLDEVLNTAEKTQKNVEKDLEKMLKQTDELKKEMGELNKELLKKQTDKQVDWKEQKKAQEIIKKQQELADKMNKLADNLNNMSKDLQDNKAISPETMQKFAELQKLMQEVKSPELQRMQEQMKQAMQNVTPEQLQKAMKEVQFNEEKFRKSIERTLSLLKKLKAEQKLDALAKRAEDLQKRQEELENKTDNTKANSEQNKKDIADEQKSLREDFDKMKDDLNDLEKLMKEIKQDMPLDELAQAKEDMKQDAADQDMDEAEKQAKNGNMEKSKQAQKKAAKKMKKFADKMKDVKKEMYKKTKKEAIKQLQKNINDMLSLSKDQNDLRQKTEATDMNSTQLPDFTDQQSNMLESMANIANGMMMLAQKSFAVTPEMAQNMGDAMQSMQNSVESLSDRHSQNAAGNMAGAMGSMNQAISQMQKSLSQLQNPGSGSCENPGGTGEGQSGDSPGGQQGMAQKLQQLASQQQAMNQAMKQMMGNGQGGSMTQEQQAEYGRMAGNQGKAQKSLEELAKEQKQIGGKREANGNLDKIAEEMKEVISDMQSGKITQETIKRQEKILSRLLDATRSMNDRDFEKKRESNAGKDIFHLTPDNLDMNSQEGKTRSMQDILRSIRLGYTKDYDALIKKYFETISKKAQ